MSRRFGKIASSIWASQRFRLLEDDVSKLAYFYLHTNTHGNCTGCYRLPAAYISADMRIDATTADRALANLTRAGLIERDADEEVIRIKGWWAFNPLTNRKHLSAAITAQQDLPRASHLALLVAIEVAEAMIPVATGWASDGSTKGRDAMLDALGMARGMVLNALRAAPEAAITKVMNDLPIELSEQLSQALSIEAHEFRSETETETQTRDTDRDKRQRRVTEAGNGLETAPDKSDVAASIRELNSRAGRGAR